MGGRGDQGHLNYICQSAAYHLSSAAEVAAATEEEDLSSSSSLSQSLAAEEEEEDLSLSLLSSLAAATEEEDNLSYSSSLPSSSAAAAGEVEEVKGVTLFVYSLCAERSKKPFVDNVVTVGDHLVEGLKEVEWFALLPCSLVVMEKRLKEKNPKNNHH